jgi:hypothetical protein
MEKTGYIEITIKGKRGNIELSPDNYDIREIRALLENVEDLIVQGEKKDRPTISYEISEGTVRHKFKTTIQTIIAFSAILTQINKLSSIDFLDYPTARVIEDFQKNAVGKDLSFTINTSVNPSQNLRIDKTTNFRLTESVWVDSEFYFYGKITNMGGKDKANIHLVTEESGTIIIQTPKKVLEEMENNPMYKTYGIRAIGKQNSTTGEIDRNSLKFIEIVIYQPKYDENYLKNLRDKAMKNWLGTISPDSWLQQIRS